MKISFALIACALLLAGCSGGGSPDSAIGEYHNEKLATFLAQFAQYGNRLPGGSFFKVRELSI